MLEGLSKITEKEIKRIPKERIGKNEFIKFSIE